ncbi:hypothetical protein J6590_018232 [Homalodisca vitripennis]|nr:hypothetical protein J6590_018232 [Homalodisca vitripennis]
MNGAAADAGTRKQSGVVAHAHAHTDTGSVSEWRGAQCKSVYSHCLRSGTVTASVRRVSPPACSVSCLRVSCIVSSVTTCGV